MNRHQKIALFNLTVILFTCAVTSVTVYLAYTKLGPDKAQAGFSTLAFCALLAFGPIIFKKKKGQGVEVDERDRLIHIRSAWAGFGSSYGYFIVVCMGIWSIKGHDGVVSANILPLMVAGGALMMETGRSISVLVQYGWGFGRSGDDEG